MTHNEHEPGHHPGEPMPGSGFVYGAFIGAAIWSVVAAVMFVLWML